MNQQNKFFGILTITLAFACLAAAPSQARSDVRMQLSSQETFVGMPVTLFIQIENAESTSPPAFQEIDGLDIRTDGVPRRSSRVSIINGRRTESSSVTYSYQFTPRREGTFEIPSITVETSDGTRRTRPVRISATTSETGDLMFAEVAGQKEKLYVGQPIDLTLRIWLKSYRDQKHNVTISASDMWRMIAKQTQWGAFGQTLEKMASEGKSVRGREVLRKDENGIERSYYLYEVDATYYPKRAGQIDVADVQIVAQYPTQLGQSRDPFESFFGSSSFGRSMFDDDFFKHRGASPFGRSLSVTAARPIVVTPEVAPIEVTPIPTEGRPADYRGAVGQYEMVTQATPNQVKAGDPITLKIGIRGTGPMELVQAPPLSELPSLTSDFKVSDEPLAGVVQDNIKVFSTTIRPRREGISHVLSIPFSFFDPATEEFVSVLSDPISITVDKAETLALDSIVGSSGSRKLQSPRNEAADGPVFDNYHGDSVLTSQTASPDPRFWFSLFLAPTALLGLFLFVRNRERWIPQPGTRTTLAQINRANETHEVAKAVLDMIAYKLGRQQVSLTRTEAIAELSTLADSATIEQLESFLVDCEHAAFTGDMMTPLSETKLKARDLVTKLALLQPPKSFSTSWKAKFQRPQRLIPAAALGLAVVAATTYSFVTVFGAPSSQPGVAKAATSSTVELDETQQATLLAEATSEYERAVETKSNGAAEAKAAFAKAAQKYQTLVNSGVHNSRLYYNLGNACLQSDSVGRAIANYRRASKLRTLDSKIGRNLSFAHSVAGNQNANEASTLMMNPVLLKTWITGLPSSVWLTILAIGWILLCLSILTKTLQPKFRVRFVAIPAMILVFTASGLIAYSANVSSPLPAAIVVATDVPVYEGSSEAFPQMSNVNITEGDAVQVIQRRGDWLQIRSSTGDQGWMKAELLEYV